MMQQRQHPCAPLIKSQGLRRACLYHDLASAWHRLQLTDNRAELDALTDEQIVMLLVMSNQTPDTPAWAYAESRLGPLPRKE